jgi:hypothetical protein
MKTCTNLTYGNPQNCTWKTAHQWASKLFSGVILLLLKALSTYSVSFHYLYLHVRSYYPNRNFINWGKRRYKSTWYALIESPSFVSIKNSIHPFFHSPLQMLLLTVDNHKNMKLTPFCQRFMWEKQPKLVSEALLIFSWALLPPCNNVFVKI